ncbi:MAG: hypothetical protein IJC99_02100 [Clostridia bacterium]|nr:hypothetical protein [Clostridia bacterium]
MVRIRVAELNIEIDNRYPFTEKFCRGFLAEFAVPDLKIAVTEADIAAERAADPYHNDVGYLECICIYRAIALQLPRFDAMVFHAAVIAKGGRAVAFAAHSGTGKSTHIALWQQEFGDAVTVVNGDKPIFRRIDGRWYAFGTPWRGKESLGGNSFAPLAAICFLERGKENSVVPVGDDVAVARLFSQTLLPTELLMADKHLSLLDDLILKTPTYLLHCNMEPEAAHVAHAGLLKGN